MPAPTKPLVFDLCYRREAYIKERGKLVRHEAGDARLPEVPAQFSKQRGSYNEVSATATRLNDAQMRSGFLSYLFFPEVAPLAH